MKTPKTFWGWTLKTWALVLGFLICVILAVMGWHWTEVANKPFWWKFWVGAAIVGLAGVAGIVWYVASIDKKK